MTLILVVEDDTAIREIVRDILIDAGYEVIDAANGRLALRAIEQGATPDLILADVMMPEMDGYELIRQLHASPQWITIPFVFLSALTNSEDVNRARELGSDDYLFKPFKTDDLLRVVRSKLARRQAVRLFDTREAHLQTLALLANVIEMRDQNTHGHIERVQNLARAFADALGWSPEAKAVMEYGALLHDIGKLAVPRSILNKPGPLTSEEFEIVKSHTTMGAQMIAQVRHLAPAVPYVRHHHERWDGRGYPDGLAGNNIPVEGRFLALVDVYDALTSDRPYRSALPKNEVVAFIEQNKGTIFDPNLADKFIKVIDTTQEKEENDGSDSRRG